MTSPFVNIELRHCLKCGGDFTGRHTCPTDGLTYEPDPWPSPFDKERELHELREIRALLERIARKLGA